MFTVDVKQQCNNATTIHMVKGIINAFDHMELCLVIYLTKGGNWDITLSSIFATGYVVLLLLIIPGSKYLPPAKEVNF